MNQIHVDIVVILSYFGFLSILNALLCNTLTEAVLLGKCLKFP